MAKNDLKIQLHCC